MASKQKRKPPNAQATGAPLRLETDRLIEKGRFKDAVKEAKLCFRAEPTPEHHQLLERAYFLRAKQLSDGTMPDSAREVAGHLLDFGITDPKLAEPAASLLVALGLSGQALHLRDEIEDPAARDRVFLQAADQAVLHPERPSLSVELTEGGRLVRNALAALAKGDAEAAAGAFRDIARNSPFADWRLFSRGLAAHNQHNAAEAAANWDRLDPDRAAFKIARALRSLNQPGPSDKPLPKVGSVEKACFGELVLEPLHTIKELITEDRVTEALRVVGPLRFALRRIDPALAERLTHVLCPVVFQAATESERQKGRGLLEHFIRVAEPLSIDPRWNRLRGLWCDAVGENLDISEAFWRQYLKDIESDPALFGDNSHRAQALVWLHLGRQFADLLKGHIGTAFTSTDEAEMCQDAKRMALECFELSLKLLPSRIETYKELGKLHERWEEPLKAARVARRSLEVFPDDLETLGSLVKHHKDRGELAAALPYLQRMRALKPLDKNLIAAECSERVALARAHALAGKWSDGRAEFETIERLIPDAARSVPMLTCKAAFELKAGEPDRAQEYINEAVDLSPVRASFWLMMVIEARRIGLPKAELDRFDQRWTAEFSKKPNSKTAGIISRVLDDCLRQKITYPGMESHVRDVLGYLAQTKRLKYSRLDLAYVCRFLRSAPRGAGLALGEIFAKRGLKLFPKAAEFPMMLGTDYFLSPQPTYRGMTAAKNHLEQARRLAETETADNPEGATLVPTIQEMLARLAQTRPMSSFRFPFSRAAGSDPMREMINEIAAELGISPDEIAERLSAKRPLDDLLGFDDDDDDDDDDEEEPPRARPKTAKARKNKKG